MPEKIVQLNEEVIKGQLKELVRVKILVLNAKEVLHLFRIIFLPKARCGSARI